MGRKSNDKTYEVKNNPENYPPNTPYLLYDKNGETIITRTAKGINEGDINPFETDMMEVTLYESTFVKALLESIDSALIMDVAQAIDDEETRHVQEDGLFTHVVSYSYGTGRANDVFYSYDINNLDYDRKTAMDIAESILFHRNKVEAYRSKMELHKKSRKAQEESNINSPIPEHDPDMELLYQQIAELKAEVNQLAAENAAIKENLNEEPESAFNTNGNTCFTKAKMGLLIHTIASITDGPIPVKTQLVPIISAIGGWEATSVSSEIRKAGFKQIDIDAVAELFEDAMPKFAAEIKKQIPRQSKTKK